LDQVPFFLEVPWKNGHKKSWILLNQISLCTKTRSSPCEKRKLSTGLFMHFVSYMIS